MILFQEDYPRFPGSILDYNTANKSFLRQVEVYRRMGVKNCGFILSLMQPELVGVDPHSPNLTAQQKHMIGVECKFNPWYYFREVVRIPPVAGPKPIQFRANRGNIALIWLFLCNVDVALIQPRQTGKSVSTDTLMDWILYIGAQNTRINMITKDDTLRKANVERLKKIRDYLPSWLVPISRADSDNQYELTCKSKLNSYTSGVSQNSETSANNLARGLTAPVTHIDEGPFISFIGITLPAALASGIAAREEAALHGQPHGNIFTTTAGKKDDRDGRYMYDMIHGGVVWSEKFFDVQDKYALRQLVKQTGSGKRIVNCTFSHRQLGKTDMWLYDSMALTGASGEAADRDFFNIWTSGTQSSPLSVKLNETIWKSEEEVKFTSISKDLYVMRWYIDEDQIAERMASGRYVIGMDTSEAVGRDAIGIVIIDVTDLSVIAAATCNETNLIRFSDWISSLLVQYKNTTLIIERKSTGGMIIDSLLVSLPLAGEDPFKRIYNTIIDNAAEYPDRFKAIKVPLERRDMYFYDEYKRYFGFNTSSNSRAVLYSTVLQNTAKNAGHLVRDKTLSAEIRGLVVKNGRIDHVTSGNDDMVISWLLANWMVTHSKNLYFYGIDPAMVMRAVTDGRTLTESEIFKRTIQESIKVQMVELYEQLTVATNDMHVAKLEMRLKALNFKYVPEDSEAYSFDAVIQQAREKRKATHRSASRDRAGLQLSHNWRKAA